MAVAIAGLLVAYLALFPALFAAALVCCSGALRTARAAARTGRLGVHRVPGRTVLFGGFPWALLGYSQASVLPVAQLASLVGVYGLSALIVWVGAARSRGRSLERSRSSSLALVSAAMLVAGVSVWGANRLSSAAMLREGTPVTVGLIQGTSPRTRNGTPRIEDAILSGVPSTCPARR